MDKQKLEERLELLQVQFNEAKDRKEQAETDMIAIDGAIQEVNYWINKLGAE